MNIACHISDFSAVSFCPVKFNIHTINFRCFIYAEGQDFIEIDRLPLNFSPTVSSVTVNVSTLSDPNAERNETFQCVVEFGAFYDIPLSLIGSEVSIVIQDISEGTERALEEVFYSLYA